jgi:hypothetical protein
MDPSAPRSDRELLVVPPRWRLVRDLLVFQGKLFLGGLVGVVIGPISILAAALGVVFRNDRGRLFYDVLRAGRRSEHWIQLYADAEGDATRAPRTNGLDAIVGKLEHVVVDLGHRGREASNPEG